MTSSTSSNSGSESLKCQASINASLDCLNLSLGRPSLPTEACLFTLLSQTFSRISDTFHLNDFDSVLADPSVLERMLRATFDNSSLPFLTEKSVRLLAGLDEHDKTCLYVQAVAGLVAIFRRLSTAGSVLSAGLFTRELRLFAESEQREAMLEKIGGSSLLRTCYTKNAIVDLVMAAVEQYEVEQQVYLAKEDPVRETILWGVNDRPCKNMGLPWGFTIMALN